MTERGKLLYQFFGLLNKKEVLIAVLDITPFLRSGYGILFRCLSILTMTRGQRSSLYILNSFSFLIRILRSKRHHASYTQIFLKLFIPCFSNSINPSGNSTDGL